MLWRNSGSNAILKRCTLKEGTRPEGSDDDAKESNRLLTRTDKMRIEGEYKA
eukprot:jgi/Botrbrau1/3466/Bobra.139_1s0041.1